MDIERSFQTALDGLVGFLPNLLGFAVVLIVGFIIAKVVRAVIRKLLDKLGLDAKVNESDASRYVDAVIPGASPSNGIAWVTFWLVFAFFIFSAIGALGVPALTTFMNQVLAYLPNVIAAILIFVLAALIAGAVGAAVARIMGDTPTGKIVGTVLPSLVMVIALFMILQQLQIAPPIVQIAFAATIGAIALGLALAFGLGGRPVAQRMLEDAYARGQEHKDQVKRDVATGRERAQRQADRARTQVEDRDASSSAGSREPTSPEDTASASGSAGPGAPGSAGPGSPGSAGSAGPGSPGSPGSAGPGSPRPR